MDTSRLQAVQQELRQLGWLPIEGGTAIGEKAYVTAVGIKVAHAYLSWSADEDPNQTLYGDYWSEGRNIMPWVLIPKAASAETVARLVRDFARGADKAVSESYVGRLAVRQEN